MTTEASVSEGEPKDWVREHRVTYEEAPHIEVRRHEKLVVGVELRLHAPRSGPCTSDPGCPSCHAIHEKLREIAHRVAPNGVQRMAVFRRVRDEIRDRLVAAVRKRG